MGGSEGCFQISIFKSTTITGYAVKLVYQVTQHSIEENLMKSFIKYLNSGNIHIVGEVLEFRVVKLKDITDKIIPFFNKYPIHGVKALDFDPAHPLLFFLIKKSRLAPRVWLMPRQSRWTNES